MKSVEQGEIDLFLKRHAPISSHEQLCVGEFFDDWRITAFLGRGGGGEVYRVVNARDAAIECRDGTAKVRLENCLFNNRSKTFPSKVKIRYKLAGGACLNFTEHEDDVRWQDCVEPFDGAYNAVRFKGPEAIEDYNRLRQTEFQTD
jgi:hypothetical protein